MHSKKIGNVFSAGLIHRFLVRLITTGLIGLSLIRVKLFFDKADVPAAFHAGESNFGKVIDVGVEAHILLQIVH